MKINDEGRSNAAYWYERAMKAEARLAEAEALLRHLRGAVFVESREGMANRIGDYLSRKKDE